MSFDPDRRISTHHLVPATGLDKETLKRIAADLRINECFAEAESTELVVDYIHAVPEHAKVRTPDIMPARPVLIEPLQIIFTLEHHMFGGDVYASIVCEGHVITQPIKWHSYDQFGQFVIKA